MKYSREDQIREADELRTLFPSGSIVWTQQVYSRRDKNGNRRVWLDVYGLVKVDDKTIIRRCTWGVACFLGCAYDSRREAIKNNDNNAMDPGRWIAHALGAHLYGDGAALNHLQLKTVA